MQVLREKDKVSPVVPSHEHDNMPNSDVDLVYIELKFPIGICNMYDDKEEELGLLFCSSYFSLSIFLKSCISSTICKLHNIHLRNVILYYFIFSIPN